jgi:HD-GYP domain-containing protein (c-di-GMP phosphodiesterase class II)
MVAGPPAAADASGTDWKARHGVARALRWAIALAPFAVAAVVSVVCSLMLPRPTTWVWALSRVGLLAMVSMVTIAVVERVARKLLPLSSLLRLSLVFPDRTPSRFKLALKAGSGRRMERALADARTNGLSPDRADAAEQIVLLSTSIGAHDRRTRGHSERVRLYADLLGEELHLGDEDRQKLQWAALIHDMGKITVPPEILNKKGKPTDDEWAILQNHPLRGEELVAPVADWLGEWVHAVGGHHERWDGTGYPRQLTGHDIPRAAAIVAVADSFEVMTAVRSYKSAMSLADARAELTRCSGTHFSPDVVRAFLNISLPRLRRVGGAIASLAHVPLVGNAISAGAKAPEAWGYGLTNLASAGGSAVTTAAVTGLLIAAPATASDQPAHPPSVAVTAAAVDSSSASSQSSQSATAPFANESPDPSDTTDGGPPTTVPDRSTPTTTTPDGSPKPASPIDAVSPTTRPTAPTTTVLPVIDSPPPTLPPLTAPTTTRPTAPTTTAPVVTTIGSIAQLITVLAPDPDAYGDRGSNLYDKLVDLQQERVIYGDAHQRVRDDARDLLDDVDKWLKENRLDDQIGADAIRLLTPLT